MKKDWTYKKLGEVAEIYQPKTLATSELILDGKYLVYGANGVIGRYNEYNHKEKEILVTCRGATCGTINISEPYSWINGNAMVVHIIDDTLLFDFLKYSLKHLDWTNIITGAAQPQITRQNLSPALIPIPPLSIQRSIVAELDLLHSVISNKKEQLRELDNLAQSLFYQMFGDPITNPMGWEVKKLGEVAEEKLSYGSGASAIDFDKEVRYIRITDINDDGSLNENAVSPSVCEDKYILHSGDILFARTGATVGKTYLHTESAMKCIYAGYLIRFIPNNEVINPLYAFHFTKTRYYHDFVEQTQRAVAQPNINAQQYSNLALPLPPLSLQQSFAAKVSAIEEQKQAITQSIHHTEALLAQRMDQYFG